MKKRWTYREIQILKDCCQEKSRKELCDLLPNRTLYAIQYKIYDLKLTIDKRTWTTEQRFWYFVDKKQDNECWNWSGACDSSGYGNFRIHNKLIGAHIFSYILHFGKPSEDKPFVLHHCDNPKCVNPNCLWVGTKKDNSDDKVMKNRQTKGENVWCSKLTENQVKEIRALCIRKELTQTKIAKMFGVNPCTISNIHRNQRWKHNHDTQGPSSRENNKRP